MSVRVTSGCFREGWAIQGEEMPAPLHRQGWRLLACSPGLYGLVASFLSVCLAVYTLTLLTVAGQFEWFVIAVVFGVAQYSVFAERLRRLTGFRFSTNCQRWVLHRLRLNGEDPDPLFLSHEDADRAWLLSVEEDRLRACRLNERLEEQTAPVAVKTSRRPARL